MPFFNNYQGWGPPPVASPDCCKFLPRLVQLHLPPQIAPNAFPETTQQITCDPIGATEHDVECKGTCRLERDKQDAGRFQVFLYTATTHNQTLCVLMAFDMNIGLRIYHGSACMCILISHIQKFRICVIGQSRDQGPLVAFFTGSKRMIPHASTLNPH